MIVVSFLKSFFKVLRFLSKICLQLSKHWAQMSTRKYYPSYVRYSAQNIELPLKILPPTLILTCVVGGNSLQVEGARARLISTRFAPPRMKNVARSKSSLHSCSFSSALFSTVPSSLPSTPCNAPADAKVLNVARHLILERLEKGTRSTIVSILFHHERLAALLAFYIVPCSSPSANAIVIRRYTKSGPILLL